jgi:hypothetical protein
MAIIRGYRGQYKDFGATTIDRGDSNNSNRQDNGLKVYY